MKFFRFLACAGMLACGPALAQDIGGDYAVEGTNLDGSAYRGAARIVITSKTTCEIFWKTGGTTSKGICMRNANAFSAAYTLGSSIGLVIYRVADDGSMDGIWTIAGKSGSGTERLIRP